MKRQALPLLMETVNPQFVRDVVASVDPRLVAVLKRLRVWDRVLGLYAEAELADLNPAEVATLPLSDGDLKRLGRIAGAATHRPACRVVPVRAYPATGLGVYGVRTTAQ